MSGIETDYINRNELCKKGTNMNKEELKAMVLRHDDKVEVDSLSVDDLLDYLCKSVCPKLEFTPATEDVIDDITFDTDSGYSYKGTPVDVNLRVLGEVEGTFGKMYLVTFTHDGETKEFILKDTKRGTKLEEITVLEDFTRTLSCPGIIRLKKVGINNVMMPKADSDLYDYQGRLTHYQANNIINIIGNSLLCLAEKGAYYLDIKPANILIRCDGSFDSDIFLGDMGSLISYHGNYIATYPPIEYRSGHVRAGGPDEMYKKIYSYQLALMYCFFIAGERGSNLRFSKISRSVHLERWAVDIKRTIDSTIERLSRYPHIKKLSEGATENKYTKILGIYMATKDIDTLPTLEELLELPI